MPINEEAFRDARHEAEKAWHAPVDRQDALAKQEQYERALIRAYLSHPAVRLAAADGVDPLADHNTAMALGVLQAIGARAEQEGE